MKSIKSSSLNYSLKKRKSNVQLFNPYITSIDKKIVNESLSSRTLTTGPVTQKFENDFKKFTGSKYATATSNATSALHLSLLAMGIGKSDEVIIPNITFVATGNSVFMTGATPVLADVNLDDINISTESIEKNITKKTKAIIPVHFSGKSCNMKKIMSIAKENNLIVIEDCAHSIGCNFNGKHVGTFGSTGCFSFYPTKNITTIEGGMIISNSNTIAKKTKLLRSHGISKTLQERYKTGFPWEYDIKEFGFNYRLDDVRSSLGISQLKNILQFNNSRRKAFAYYYEKLYSVDGIELPEIKNLQDNACHLFVIKINKEKFGISRNQVFKRLLKNGISTTVHYKPLSLFSVFRDKAKNHSTLENSIKLYDQILSLPLYTKISKKAQDKVIQTLKNL